MLRIDSPILSNRERYEEDKRWFKDNPKRRMFFRSEIDEFDPVTIPMSERLQMPRLHVLVTEIAPSVHSVQPIYRGKQFWNHHLDSDSAVASVLVEMQQQRGYDAKEFSEFLDRVAAKNKAFAVMNATGKVH
ncbi:hypothetical protein [Granulicella arctica]|uniref:Uncharacterized protein n=1 Tax=Granulicella arctica TaxID=940613 RepID=A0A7Y9PIK4_9BACT|nr:hypothetical protein [Granulicella arctica]NYF80573.1 hypothetical protein [Granulicella arctica]